MTYNRVYCLECEPDGFIPRFYFGSTYREMHMPSEVYDGGPRAVEHMVTGGSKFTERFTPKRFLFVALEQEGSSHIEQSLTRLFWHIVGWRACRGGDLTCMRSDMALDRRWMWSAPEFQEDPDSPGPLPANWTKYPDEVRRLAKIVCQSCGLSHPWIHNP